MKKGGSSWTMAGAMIAGIAASLCCIGPLLSLSLGLGSFAASSFFAQWRPALLALTFGLLGVAWYLALSRAKATCVDRSCARVPGNATWLMLSFGTFLALASAAYPWWARIERHTSRAVPALAGAQTLSVAIPTMDCAACAKGIEASLRRMPGVLHAHVDYATKRAEIAFDPAKTKRETLLAGIDETGFPADRSTLK